MTVYVDQFFSTTPSKKWRHYKACHMWADSLEELLLMAAKIGLDKRWIQRKSIIHFDLSESKRELAVAYGAKEVTWRDMYQFMRSKKRGEIHQE